MFGTKDFFGPKNLFFWTQKLFFWTQKLSWTQKPRFFGVKNFSDPNFFFTKKDLVWFYGLNLPNQNHLNQRLSKLNTLDLSLVDHWYVKWTWLGMENNTKMKVLSTEITINSLLLSKTTLFTIYNKIGEIWQICKYNACRSLDILTFQTCVLYFLS